LYINDLREVCGTQVQRLGEIFITVLELFMMALGSRADLGQ
jgi:hypothetical protein